MKTKTLVVTAALSLAAIGSTMAQVYSLNTVGYVNTVCNSGFTLIANPLNTTNNTLGALLPTPPETTRVYKWDATVHHYVIATYDWSDALQMDVWDTPNLTLSPGEGFFFFNPTTTPYTQTWVGEVLQGSLTNGIPLGFSLQASQVPQAGQLDTVLGYTPSETDRVYFWRANKYDVYTYDWSDATQADAWDKLPVAGVGEGFFIFTATPQNWIRTFTVQ